MSALDDAAAPMGEPVRVRDADTLTLLGGRIGRDALIYATTGVITIFFGLISIAVLTRLLPPSQYGHLAVYAFFMTVLMVVYNLGSLQGTMSFVFGGGGDEDDDGDDELLDPALITSGDRRRALGTGITLTFLVGAIGTIPVWVLAPKVAPLVSRGSHSAATIRWAAVAAVLAAMWRLTGNVTRVERRPYAYAFVHVLHPLLTMAVSIPLLATGYGVEGAVAGLAFGNAAAFLVSLVAIHRSVRPAFSPRDVVQIYRLGGARVFITMSTWLIHNGDVFMASRYLGAPLVGVYRVGSRVGAVTAHWTSAFNMSYGPLRRDPLFLAATRESGTTTQATVAAYFVIVTTTVVLAMAVFARLLVHVAGARYRAAAPLIPLAAISFAGHGLFVLSYRLCTFATRRRWFISLGVVALAVFVGSGILLTQAIGIYGPIAAAALAQMFAAVVMVVRNQLGENPVPFQWWRIARVPMCAGATYLAYEGACRLVPAGRPLFAPVALIVYGLLLIMTGVIPIVALQNVRSMLRAVPQQWPPGVVSSKLAAMTVEDRRLLRRLAHERLPAREVASSDHVDEAAVHVRLIAILRGSAGIERDGEHDARVGYYVLYRGAAANRELIAHELYEQGVEPVELHALQFAYASFRRAPARVWVSAAAPGRAALASVSVSSALRR